MICLVGNVRVCFFRKLKTKAICCGYSCSVHIAREGYAHTEMLRAEMFSFVEVLFGNDEKLTKEVRRFLVFNFHCFESQVMFRKNANFH